MSSVGSLSWSATSPKAVETQAGAFWKPSCGGSLLLEQSRASTSRPLLFAMSLAGAVVGATVADGSTVALAAGSAGSSVGLAAGSLTPLGLAPGSPAP